KNIKLRYIPEIVFKLDDSIEKGMYMDSLIKRVNEKNAQQNEDENYDE
ncbi:ribosome-binding factor A, partial [Clostridioides difficile]